MLDDILEFIFEIILEGAVEATSSKQVPMVVRILLGVIILVFVGGIFGLLLWIGIQDKSVPIIIIALALIVIFLVLTIRKVRELKNK